MCEEWYCLTCTKLKKSDVCGPIFSRSDIFWTCSSCTQLIPLAVAAFKTGAPTAPMNTSDMDTIKACISKTIKQELPSALDQCMESVQSSVCDSMSGTVKSAMVSDILPAIDHSIAPIKETVEQAVRKTWASTVFEESEFPEINSPEAKDAPIKPKQTLSSALKRAVIENKKDESRQSNLIIHKAAESTEKKEVRQKKDEEMVEELLGQLGVEHKPTKVYRLGKYDANDQRSRPIKVIFQDSVAQDQVMQKAYKLKEAPDHLKKLSLNYDMSKDERAECKRLVEDAKDQTKNSKTHKYKVVGRPGEMKIKEIQLKTPTS